MENSSSSALIPQFNISWFNLLLYLALCCLTMSKKLRQIIIDLGLSSPQISILKEVTQFLKDSIGTVMGHVIIYWTISMSSEENVITEKDWVL